MSADAGYRDRSKLRDLWTLPKVIAIDINRIHYAKPRQFVLKHELQDVNEAVEFVIHTSEEMPERAIAPVLFVGNHRLTESEPAGHRMYRFFGFDFEKLEEGAPIALGWDVSSTPKSETGFYYRLDRK